jgi:hypothetical protein
MSWGRWEEDRRYPSEDGEHVIVVSKRTNGEGKTFWKNEPRALPRPTPADRAYYQSRQQAAEGGTRGTRRSLSSSRPRA